MIGARFIAALGDLATVLLAEFAPPERAADGSFQGNVVVPAAELLDAATREQHAVDMARRATSVQRDVKPENVRPGLVPCSTCNTLQRPGAVHFRSNTELRPCAGSWRRR